MLRTSTELCIHDYKLDHTYSKTIMSSSIAVLYFGIHYGTHDHIPVLNLGINCNNIGGRDVCIIQYSYQFICPYNLIIFTLDAFVNTGRWLEI